MNIQRTVYEKINSISPKVELSQIEIELALIDDLQKRFKDIIENNNKASQRLDTILTESKINLNMYKEAGAQIEVLLSNIDEFKKKTEVLGLDLPKELLNIISMSAAIKKNISKSISNIDKSIQLMDKA